MTSPKKPSAKTAAQDSYTAADIESLEPVEAVRLRPGMYIGGTHQKALHHLIWEIVDNSVDEAIGGYCNEISVSIDKDNVVEVQDNGRGIPPQETKKGKSALITVFTELHAGGKFGKTEGGYDVSGGLHGVGASVTNFLSEWLEVEVVRDGFVWSAAWKKGEDWKPLKQIRKMKRGESTGTKVRFLYDGDIFDDGVKYSMREIEERLQQKAYLVRGLRFAFTNPDGDSREFFSEEGIKKYIDDLAEQEETKPLHKTLFFADDAVLVTDAANKEVRVGAEVAFHWTEKSLRPEGNIRSFTNIVVNPDGGTHVTGLSAALTRVMNNFAIEQGKFKANKTTERFKSQDVLASLTAIVSVKVSQPSFNSQTKERLISIEARSAVSQMTFRLFTDWINDKKNTKDAKAILDRCYFSWKNRVNDSSKKAYVPGTMSGDSGQSKKLKECRLTTPPEERELFLVEGDSAGGTAENSRDNKFQAIMALKGKVMNALSGSNDKVFQNEEVKGIISALGASVEIIEGQHVVKLPYEARRYGKVVIAADADEDGSHIGNLIVVLFHQLFPEYLREGRLFLAIPPLYRITVGGRGETVHYAYSDEERRKVTAGLRGKITINRFKGLGEMNADQLGETVMLPDTRRLAQVTVEDSAELLETLYLVMGGSSPKLIEKRREWISKAGRDRVLIS